MAQLARHASLDRRARRRRETIEEILDVALEVMAAEGMAALSLAEVARRMGMRPPSLYQYFPSKAAIYDALFGEGARRVRVAWLEAEAGLDGADPLTRLRATQEAFCRWCIQNPVLSQLLFWRTVPGFEPSPESFAPAAELLDDMRSRLRAAVEAGQLAPEAAGDEGVTLYTSLLAGVVSQQFANEPNASYEQGRFISLNPTVLDMFIAWYAPKENTS
ncbi:MAG TPA: TetR/AcrR family transcriptional regulator [Mycobacterium sp.]|nr:TetR/AcrR family transcriptional regulator [Mycobacterium sp.]